MRTASTTKPCLIQSSSPKNPPSPASLSDPSWPSGQPLSLRPYRRALQVSVTWVERREQQPNRLADGALFSGNRPAFCKVWFFSRWMSIFLITLRASMPVITLTCPPGWLHVSISMLNACVKRCAQVIVARRSARILSPDSFDVLAVLRLPCLPGVSNARCSLIE